MRPLNRDTLAKNHKGKWIALKADRRTVVASGGSVKSVMAAAAKKGHRNPIVTRVPQSPASFIGSAYRE